VDHLIAAGHKDVSVLDLSSAALSQAQARLGEASSIVEWIVADASIWSPSRSYDIWHDRAAFHFLTEPEQQSRYMDRVRSALRPGGHVVIGTFAPDGPEKCSGLLVVRHDAKSLGERLGESFALLDTREYEHSTPWDSKQKFQFSTFNRVQ
jgi:trans-aconitate methyltransferase